MNEQKTRIEIVGLHHLNNGRQCIHHEEGCGSILKVGAVYRFDKIVLDYEHEYVEGSRYEELMEYSKALLLIISKELVLKAGSNMNKKDLVQKLLEHEERDDCNKQSKTILKTRKEVAVAVVDLASN